MNLISLVVELSMLTWWQITLNRLQRKLLFGCERLLLLVRELKGNIAILQQLSVRGSADTVSDGML